MMTRPLLNQYNMLALFDRDRSDWSDLRHYPDTVTCRRMLRFADWAAKFPSCYEASRRVYEAPELSLREVAVFAGVAWSTFRERMKATTDIDDPLDFSDKELDYSGIPAPTIPAASFIRGVSETYRNAMALADFAHDNPVRWQVIRSYYLTGISQVELGKIFNLSQSTISRYLDSIKSIQPQKEINYELL